jgi:hypothetical protein
VATHAVFTIVADVHRGAEPELEADLKAFDAAMRFVGLSGLHFASFVIFDAKCLKRPLSKLVLECAIDGPIGPFLRAVDRHCDLSRVFRHCKDYAQAENTLVFLRKHVRKPQLYHVGTPYQSAASILADIRQRRHFDHRLRNAGVPPLDALLRNVPAGMREYWRLEILEPWLALPIAVAGLWLAWLIWRHTNWHGWREIAPSILNALVAGGVVLAAFRYAFVSWQSALPQLRRRVMSWMAWLAKGAVLGALTVGVVRVWPRYAVQVESCVLLLFAAATLYKIYADVSSDRDARLAQVRGDTSIDAAWRALKNTPSDDSEPRSYQSKRWRALLNLLAYATSIALIWFALSYALSNHIPRNIVIAYVTGSVVLRAVWLSVRGFRANGLWMEAYQGIAAFLGFAAFVGILAGFTLTATPPYVAGVVGFAVLFALDTLWNWRWWITGYPLIYLPLRAAIQSVHTVELYVAITALFFLEAWWLTVLVGWPDRKRPRWSTQSKRFIVLAAIGGFILIEVLLRIHVWSALAAVIIPAALYSLWNLDIESPVVDAVRLPPERLNELRSEEDHDVQNHMAALVPLRKAWFRPAVLRSFLWLLNSLFFQAGWLRDWYKGKLFGLPTVHFCQWVLLDDRNYVFLSNYDHSWSTYLDDFGTTIGAGIQKIWGQGEGNPGTASLRAFKDYARSTMVTHANNSWYRAYPGITLRQIWNNEEIRRGVASATREEAIVRVLRRFGAAPKTLPEFINAGIR